ncbi:T9SS type A sorting domain-containing protein [Hymenobacter negativus]|uniref:T9SS type A sorting domain-containing protein n=1 Tax=Hymenobacter negativus TaxID=2795026 RepID=A0ABS3Q9F7_9BACT|nr:T9SS type A sorting domain-containing protein [Hymenobacter negativus]MBO2007886.1 T9SS type A sorting domain-containing protein [Hymenobacter negativus]
MKISLLLALLLVLSRAGFAQFPRVFIGSLDATSPTTRQMMITTGTASTCASPRAFPGLNPPTPTGTSFYATHTIANTAASPMCFTLALNSTCTDARAGLLVSAYAGTFDPANLATNYRADNSIYVGPPMTRSCSVEAAAGETLVLVVSSLDRTPCSRYALTVTAAAGPLPTATARPREALRAAPNPATDRLTLHGTPGQAYQLLNRLGQTVRAGAVSEQPVDVSTLPVGLYLLRDPATGRASRVVKL